MSETTQTNDAAHAQAAAQAGEPAATCDIRPDAQTQPGAGQQPGAQPTPERIFQALTAYQLTAALRAAIELDIFSHVAAGDDTAAKLAARADDASERGVRILCDYLTVHQFLEKRDGRYRLAPESALFLDRRSPAYVGGMADFLAGPHLAEGFQNLTEAVRKGGTALPGEGSMSPEHPMWEDFARGMAATVTPAAEEIARLVGAAGMGECKVLDIAASHGVFGLTVARHNPRAEVYACDWRNVLPFARATAERWGLADRFHEIAGSAFDVDFGEDFDLVLVPNFFHHFDPAACERLMRRIHAALKAGGRCVTLEFVPDESRVSPPAEATFPLVMLGSTPAGDAYTFSEYERMFGAAGFARSECFPAPPWHVIVSHR